MFETVSVPIWVLVFFGIFALITLLDKILFPSVRWVLRKRLEKAVERLNKRLTRPIHPFKLAKRRDTIKRLCFDPEVAQAIIDYAKAEGVPEDVAFEKAQNYAREIVPGFSALAYFGFAIRAAKWLSKSFYRVRLGHYDESALDQIDSEATVVFVMNHRSNMDYVLVTWLAAERSALAYAVGEWARIWPLQQLIRAMGGFFVRRKDLNPLYRKVLARYVQLATEGGVTQAVFPEGKLSQDGRLGAPKLGILSYILSGFDPETSRDVVFVPVGLNYDRVLEDRLLTRSKEEKAGHFYFGLGTLWKYATSHLSLRISGKFRRFGYAAVSFGAPISLKEQVTQNPKLSIDALAELLMGRIDAILPSLPVSVVAAIFQEHPDGMHKSELEAAFKKRLGDIIGSGQHAHVPREDTQYAAEVGLRMLKLRRIIENDGDRLKLNKSQEILLNYYANMLPNRHVTILNEQ